MRQGIYISRLLTHVLVGTRAYIFANVCQIDFRTFDTMSMTDGTQKRAWTLANRKARTVLCVENNKTTVAYIDFRFLLVSSILLLNTAIMGNFAMFVNTPSYSYTEIPVAPQIKMQLFICLWRKQPDVMHLNSLSHRNVHICTRDICELLEDSICASTLKDKDG